MAMSSADYDKRQGAARRARTRLAGAVAATAVAAAMSVAMAVPAGASTLSRNASHDYSFRTLDNKKDLTFNQLLGIDNEGVIAGYFGSGMTGHPNKGYVLLPPGYHQSDYVNENFPGSAQTQVTGLNNIGNTVGFWANTAGANFGFYTTGTHFHNIPKFPGSSYASPQTVQLLGINDHGVAVGFYVNGDNNDRGFTFNIHTHAFKRVLIPGASQGLTGPSLTAAAINNSGTVAGFYVASSGETVAFTATAHTFTTLVYPGSSSTSALGINDKGEVVGVYTVGTSSTPPMHGFTWSRSQGFREVNDPHGVNGTTINGVNDKGDLVGFYVDPSNGFTDGFLAKPRG
jgi:hypothetical protein